VIGADSRIGKRAYTARDQRAPVPLPEWITALLHGDTPAAKAGPASLVPESPHGTAYAMAALREEIRLVATVRPGTRNDTLNRAAFSLGQLAAAGLLPPRPWLPRSPAPPDRRGCPQTKPAAPSAPE
jgi:hypothetical protein